MGSKRDSSSNLHSLQNNSEEKGAVSGCKSKRARKTKDPQKRIAPIKDLSETRPEENGAPYKRSKPDN